MKHINWYKIIPLLALIIVVWYNTLVLHRGLSGGFEKISQLINQRDMRLVALLISGNFFECQKMNEKELSGFINSNLSGTMRLIGFYPMSKDIWGNPYQIQIEPHKIIIRSSGPDEKTDTKDDSQFVLPVKPATPGEDQSE